MMITRNILVNGLNPCFVEFVSTFSYTSLFKIFKCFAWRHSFLLCNNLQRRQWGWLWCGFTNEINIIYTRIVNLAHWSHKINYNYLCGFLILFDFFYLYRVVSKYATEPSDMPVLYKFFISSKLYIINVSGQGIIM